VGVGQALRRAASAHAGAGAPERAIAALDRARSVLDAAVAALAGDAGDESPGLERALCYERGEVEDMTARLLSDGDGGDLDAAVAAAGAAADWHDRAGAWADASAAAVLAGHVLCDRLARPADAEPWARRAVAALAAGDGEDVDPDLLAIRVAQAHGLLADVLDALGRSAEAGGVRATAEAAWAAYYRDGDDEDDDPDAGG
jgi:hypothetical protein